MKQYQCFGLFTPNSFLNLTFVKHLYITLSRNTCKNDEIKDFLSKTNQMTIKIRANKSEYTQTQSYLAPILQITQIKHAIKIYIKIIQSKTQR